MKNHPLRIEPFGQRAVLVEWPAQVSESILAEILDFVDSFKNLGLPNWEVSVAYNSLTLVNTRQNIDFEQVKTQILSAYEGIKVKTKHSNGFLWKLPVCYEEEFGLDLKEAAEVLGMTIDELIREHTAYQYTVYGIGFLPGFMYLGGLPQQLEIPRRKEPRLSVARGSVGLAGKQTGIYPQNSPGGWNIIGSCPIPIFDISKEQPCFVKVGDKIQFEPISKAAYDLKKIEAEVGIYQPQKKRLNA
ncbi:5-oxoprolinase subunit PxpB [Flagellimonas flava]|uniref:Sensor histidine kinase inhibitor, KipI family n=1 Tax=Flagellimonas flava TaxID=570519 RepID=A0A1M5IFX2_9FLAO|nr:5-oxoprolinase subunit PxpB [Allomuricauda flava]SHG27157.1 sensor histidine kinase inhibitor, KipI family [Allomuricauda flava]